jgi:DUF4097 and DUF4098 domain-containing protein YvlB
MTPPNRPVRLLQTLACCLLLALPVTVAASGFDETHELAADSLILRNVIGQIEVRGHDGDKFEIEVRVQGADATPDRVQVEVVGGRRSEVNVNFPIDESRSYVYPRLGSGKTSVSLETGSWLSQLFGRDKLKVSGSGSGLEIWADVTVRVPRGKSIEIEHGVGPLEAGRIEGRLKLSTHSGPIDVDGVTGDTTLYTGSGRITANGIRGKLIVDTGSGRVVLRDVTGDKLSVDTGSGRVELDGVDSRRLVVDTGSGSVKAQAIRADEVSIDTGSGSVTLQLDRMGAGSFEIDTGSGSIELRLPADASAEIRADTGSGGIHLDVPNAMLRHKSRDSALIEVGGGAANVNLDTGSGSIRISQ